MTISMASVHGWPGPYALKTARYNRVWSVVIGGCGLGLASSDIGAVGQAGQKRIYQAQCTALSRITHYLGNHLAVPVKRAFRSINQLAVEAIGAGPLHQRADLLVG